MPRAAVNNSYPRMDASADRAAGATDAVAMRRVARLQATLRKLNEAIDAEPRRARIAFRCECGELGCNELILLRRSEYEAVRGNARRFVIAPGHVVAELEREVERHADYAVVQTHPHTSEFAERTYPREAPGRRP
jgi:hypothetical protein